MFSFAPRSTAIREPPSAVSSIAARGVISARPIYRHPLVRFSPGLFPEVPSRRDSTLARRRRHERIRYEERHVHAHPRLLRRRDPRRGASQAHDLQEERGQRLRARWAVAVGEIERRYHAIVRFSTRSSSFSSAWLLVFCEIRVRGDSPSINPRSVLLV